MNGMYPPPPPPPPGGNNVPGYGNMQRLAAMRRALARKPSPLNPAPVIAAPTDPLG